MWSMEYTRRDIAALTAGGLFTGLVAGAQPVFAAGPGPVSIEDTPWYGKIKRVGQTNFNERDPEQGDVEAWADYWASAKVEAVALSVSGPVAFYPTKVSFFHVSAYLNGRDLFGECLTAAKKRGIRVFGRMSSDIQFMDPKLLAAHPDWFRRDQKGELQSPAPDIAFTCQFTGQFTVQQPAILRELNERYDIDGIYMNGWPTMQVCYCEACRKIGDPQSDVYKAAVMEGAVNLTAGRRRDGGLYAVGRNHVAADLRQHSRAYVPHGADGGGGWHRLVPSTRPGAGFQTGPPLAKARARISGLARCQPGSFP